MSSDTLDRPGDHGRDDGRDGKRDDISADDLAVTAAATATADTATATGDVRTGTGRGARDPFLDNAKFLLVVLVVIGHSWGPIADGMRGLQAAYFVVYAFHMPVFALLCGHFSRGFTGRPEQIRKLLAGVLLPYLIFDTAYGAMYALVWGRPFALTPTEPLYLCWFLAALFIWRLTSPVWRAVRLPVPIAVLVSVAAGLTGVGYELGLSRVLMFLPWFVLGLRLPRERFEVLRSRLARRCAVPVLLCAAVGAWWAAPRATGGWLLMQQTASDLGVPPPVYVAMRLALFVVGAVVGAAFLALVPGRRMWCTGLGAATMYPFLLHGLVVKCVEGAGGYEVIRSGGLLAGAALTVVAAALAVGLGSPPVRRVLRPVVEPRFPRWLAPASDGPGTVRPGRG